MGQTLLELHWSWHFLPREFTLTFWKQQESFVPLPPCYTFYIIFDTTLTYVSTAVANAGCNMKKKRPTQTISHPGEENGKMQAFIPRPLYDRLFYTQIILKWETSRNSLRYRMQFWLKLGIKFWFQNPRGNKKKKQDKINQGELPSITTVVSNKSLSPWLNWHQQFLFCLHTFLKFKAHYIVSGQNWDAFAKYSK